MTTTFTFRVENSLKQRINRLCEARKLKASTFLKTLVEKAVTEEEIEEERSQEINNRMQEYRLTGEFVPHEEVRQWLDDQKN